MCDKCNCDDVYDEREWLINDSDGEDDDANTDDYDDDDDYYDYDEAILCMVEVLHENRKSVTAGSNNKFSPIAGC